VIALEELDFGFTRESGAHLGFEIGEGGMAVDFGFAEAEAVEVGAVEDGEAFHGCFEKDKENEKEKDFSPRAGSQF
jgi:hypothetical protein